jgi:hypothetical protein
MLVQYLRDRLFFTVVTLHSTVVSGVRGEGVVAIELKLQ